MCMDAVLDRPDTRAALEADFIQGARVMLDPASARVGGVWGKTGLPALGDPDFLCLMSELLRHISAPAVVDVGANSGYLSLLPLLHTGMKVFAFEPNPALYALLKKNIFLNGLDGRVETFPLALADKRGGGKIKNTFLRPGLGPGLHRDASEIC